MRDNLCQGKGNFINDKECNWNELYCIGLTEKKKRRKKCQTINGVIKLGENGLIIGLISTNDSWKGLSEMM